MRIRRGDVLLLGAAAALTIAVWPRSPARHAPRASTTVTLAATTDTRASRDGNADAVAGDRPAPIPGLAALARLPRLPDEPAVRPSADPPPLADEILDETAVREQERINHYFHADVIPRLRECWRGLGGTGTISFKHTYLPVDGQWTPRADDDLGIELDDSTLDEAADEQARACMREAVRGTSWPMGPTEGAQPYYVLYWTWPVPFPDEPARR
jgi:hypothetical protein